MAYSLIPPILVVLSLIGIIIFLMKNSSRVSLLDIQNEREERTQSGLLRKMADRRKVESGDTLKHKSLLLLEKITRRFKVLSLRLENKFASWNESVRQKRKDHIIEKKQEMMEEETNNLIEKVKEYEMKIDIENEEEAMPKMKAVEGVVKEKYIRPMLSPKVAMPKSKKPEIKDRLEKILIERIASNPKDTEAYERLGEYYFEIENYNYAKECFKQVIKLNPANMEAKNKMKRLERLLGK